MNGQIPLIFVRYASGSAGRFVSVMLQTSEKVACWSEELERHKGTAQFADRFFEYFQKGYQDDLSRHLYNEPGPDYPVWPWFSATWPRGDDLSVDEFIDQLIAHEYQYWLDNIHASKKSLLLLHKSRLPNFAYNASVVNIVIDPPAYKWLNRARYLKIFGEENGRWFSREHMPDLLQQRYQGVERLVDLPDIWLEGSQRHVVRHHVIGDPRVLMFRDSELIRQDPSNQLGIQLDINLSDILNLDRFLKAMSLIFYVHMMDKPDLELMSRCWFHYYQTNIGIFKHNLVRSVANVA